MTNRVFIIQPPTGKDISTARSFGNITVLFPKHLTDTSAQDLYGEVLACLASLRPTEADYFVLLGDPVLCALVVACVLDGLGAINLLRWDIPSQNYVDQQIRVPLNT